MFKFFRRLNQQDKKELKQSRDNLNSCIIDNFLNQLDNYIEEVYGLFIDNKMVGCIDIGYFDEYVSEFEDNFYIINPGYCYIINGITIFSQFRGKGLGKELLDRYIIKLKTELKKDFILFADSMPESVGFYKALGFNKTTLNDNCFMFHKEIY